MERHDFTFLAQFHTPCCQLKLLKANEKNGLSGILSICQQQFSNRMLLWSHFTRIISQTKLFKKIKLGLLAWGTQHLKT